MPTGMVGIDGGLAGAEPDEAPGAWPAREARRPGGAADSDAGHTQ